jgi:Fe-S-cluster containining protein
MDIASIRKSAAKKEKEAEAFCAWLENNGPSPAKLDKRLHGLLKEAMRGIDCTACAACCREAYVVVATEDVWRMAEALDMRRSDFRRAYIGRNEDGDQCFNRRPCPFLGRDRLCCHYEARPDCCRDYPFSLAVDCREKLENLSANYLVCPAVTLALDRLRAELA